MSEWNTVTRENLLTWANSDGAPGQLPELVRRLVHETANDRVEAIDFPGGSGVTAGGFDGFVRASSGTPFVPAGPSVWELSVRKDAIKKADEDIAKRISVPDGSPVDRTSYIQVIARPWTKAAGWARDWAAKSTWRRVEGYSVDRLTTWIEQAPATRVWLLERIGKPTIGVVSGFEWWIRWSTSTEPALTPDVVLARGVGDLDMALRGAGITTIGGPGGVNEIVACVVAAALAAGGDLLDRIVVVDDRNAWQRLLKEVAPLILVAAAPALAGDVGPDSPHTVVVPIPQSDDADIVLESADSNRVTEALRKLNDELPFELGSLARRSFVSFRRRLARRPELMIPPWAAGAIPRAVRAALLVTGWSDGNAADRDVVATLAGMSYEAAREQLLIYTVGDDPLLALTTDRWLLVSPSDAWQQLGRHLLTDDLRAFVEQATEVLTERDPALDLPRDERWRAGIDKKVLRHSHSLRRGVASGLALLGTYGDRVVNATGIQGEHWVAQVLRPLLFAANADRTGERWASVAELLPLLMEAAPGEVLDALRAGSTGALPVLATIFQDDPEQNSLFGPGSPHTSFLWALETIAWSAEHVGEAAELLAALATLDPGGRLSNRPSTSLANIFCPWHPDTGADVDQRLGILDRLLQRWPTVAYSLMVKLLPEGLQSVHFPTSEPTFRDWKPAQYVVLIADHWRFVEGVVDRFIDGAGDDGERWSWLLQVHQHLPRELREIVLEAAERLVPDRLAADDRLRLWEDIRKLVANHREYADANWALPPEELTLLDALARKLEPASPAERSRWLFMNQWINLGDIKRRDDFDAYDQEVADRRAAAVQDIIAAVGLDGLTAFASKVDAAVVGVALGNALPDECTLDRMLSWYETGSDTERTIAANFLWRRGRLGGLGWAVEVLAAHPDLGLGTQAELLLDSNEVPGGWEEARARGEVVDREYWLRFSYMGRGQEFPHLLIAAERLIDVGRCAAALDMLTMYQSNGGDIGAAYAEAVATALEGLVAGAADDPEIRRLDTWDYGRAFAILDAHVDSLGLSRVTQLQWNCLPALGYDPPTTTLHRALADDPAFFVEILSLIYRAKADRDTPAEAPSNSAVVENAFRLLKSWSVPPGRGADGTFHVGRCRAWIDEARRLLRDADRLDVGMEQVGEVLIFTAGGGDGWPSTQVADLIEQLDDDEIDHGISNALRNSRGVTTRGLTDGGTQERILAADFRRRAQFFRHGHPRVARILNRMAEGYEADARREDRVAECRRRGLDR